MLVAVPDRVRFLDPDVRTSRDLVGFDLRTRVARAEARVRSSTSCASCHRCRRLRKRSFTIGLAIALRTAGLLGSLGLALAACDRGARPLPPLTPQSSLPAHRIVLIVIDTLRRDFVSAYGSAVATPNIDRIAAGGQRFTNALSSFHQTSMSMAALFTGRTPSLSTGAETRPLLWTSANWCGLARFAEGGVDHPCVPESVPTLAETLRAAGYRTVGIVSNPLLYRPYGFDRGFDDWLELRDGEEISWRVPAERVNAALAEWARTNRPDRLFLYLHYMDVHDWWLDDPPPPPTNPEVAHAKYAEAVRRLDDAIGDLLALLESEDLLDQAVVILVADHGETLAESHAVPGHPIHFGNPSFETLLRVPLLSSMRLVGDPTRLVRSDDVSRLIQAAAGLAEQPSPELEADEVFLTELAFRTYRRGRWKSLWPRPPWTRPDPERSRIETLGSLPAFLAAREVRRPILFDLEGDPKEEHDVADAHPDILALHRHRVYELMRQLSATDAPSQGLTPKDAERLRALGYLMGDGADQADGRSTREE